MGPARPSFEASQGPASKHTWGGLQTHEPFSQTPHMNCMKHMARQVSGAQLPPPVELLDDELLDDELLDDELPLPPVDDDDDDELPLPPVDVVLPVDAPTCPPGPLGPLEATSPPCPPPPPVVSERGSSAPMAQLHTSALGRMRATTIELAFFMVCAFERRPAIVAESARPRRRKNRPARRNDTPANCPGIPQE